MVENQFIIIYGEGDEAKVIMKDKDQKPNLCTGNLALFLSSFWMPCERHNYSAPCERERERERERETSWDRRKGIKQIKMTMHE